MTPEELWLYMLCRKNDLPITDIQIRLLFSFKLQLLEWNKKINLVSRKNEENLWKDHIALSLTMLFKVSFPSGLRILDLGTGGGFPGIPLSIMLPDSNFLLLDSTQKKITAVQSMIESLGLKNAKAIWGRAEELQKQNGLYQSFDFVVARSVSNLTNLLEWGIPFLRRTKTSALVTFKGGEIEEERQEAQRKFPHITLQTISLTFNGSEEFENQDKKLVVATL